MNTAEIKRMPYSPVLVIGGGLAGMYAAIAAEEASISAAQSMRLDSSPVLVFTPLLLLVPVPVQTSSSGEQPCTVKLSVVPLFVTVGISPSPALWPLPSSPKRCSATKRSVVAEPLGSARLNWTPRVGNWSALIGSHWVPS